MCDPFALLECQKVVLHCVNSRSRSPCVLLAFFILRGLSRDHAVKWLEVAFHKQRPTIARKSLEFPNFTKFHNLTLALERNVSLLSVRQRIMENICSNFPLRLVSRDLLSDGLSQTNIGRQPAARPPPTDRADRTLHCTSFLPSREELYQADWTTPRSASLQWKNKHKHHLLPSSVADVMTLHDREQRQDGSTRSKSKKRQRVTEENEEDKEEEEEIEQAAQETTKKKAKVTNEAARTMTLDCRHQMVTHIMNFFERANPAVKHQRSKVRWNVLNENTRKKCCKRFEYFLFRNAPSMAVYSELSSLKRRLNGAALFLFQTNTATEKKKAEKFNVIIIIEPFGPDSTGTVTISKSSRGGRYSTHARKVEASQATEERVLELGKASSITSCATD